MNKQNGKLSLKMTLKKHIAHLRRRLKSYHNNIADNIMNNIRKISKDNSISTPTSLLFFWLR